MPTGYRFIVRGRVQGVGFRQAAAGRAHQLELEGWVLNRADGAVEGEVHHESLDALSEFQCWLRRGPPAAKVEAVEWIELPAGKPLGTGFSIRR